ncbi:MAG: tyrosine--tRNA ligase, partial [Bacilli bacterium]|nr:tyrosine--tRNA ligase [Bacilli bacterium]
HYLKVFTFMDKDTIEDYQKKTEEHPELREAQRALADTMIEFIHGKEVLKEVQMMSSALFGGEINKLSYAQLQVCLNGVPSASISEDMPLIDALVLVKAASSKREARELLGKGTYSINGEKIADLEYVLSRDNAIEKKLFVIRRGKKNYFMIEFK